jgi:hypothetical protein
VAAKTFENKENTPAGGREQKEKNPKAAVKFACNNCGRKFKFR